MKVKANFLLIAILFFGCLFFSYLWVDRSITLSYVSQNVSSSELSKKQLERLLEMAWKGLPEEVVLEKLKAEAARHPMEDVVIKKDENIIFYDWIQFQFEGGRLMRVGGC